MIYYMLEMLYSSVLVLNTNGTSITSHALETTLEIPD